MSEPRFKVTIYDRQKRCAQQYDVERVVSALCLPIEGGEAWMVSLRGMNNEQIAAAIATLIDRVADVAGTEPLEMIGDFLGRVPRESKTIDYGLERTGEAGT